MKDLIIKWITDTLGITIFQNKYFLSLFILVLFVILAKLVLFIFSRYLQKMAKKTKTKIDDLIFDHTKKPLFYLVLAYGFKLSLLNLNIGSTITKIVDSVMALVLLLIILKAIDIFVETWGITFAEKTETKLDEILLPLLHKGIKVIFVVVGFLLVLNIWGFDITPYLAGVGIGGLVLGFALQDSLKNIFGGITLILDGTYKIGDKVKIESGEVGMIHDIGLRSTKLATYDNEIIYIPNGYLANSRVQNYTRPTPKIRVVINFGVEYGSDIKKVRKVVQGTLKKIKDLMTDPEPAVSFVEMGDSSLKFKAIFWVEQWDTAYGKKLEAIEKIYDDLNKNKINIPFPTRTVYLQK